MIDLSIIIPHARRLVNLRRCLTKLVEQIERPKEIIIADYYSDVNQLAQVIEDYKKLLPIKVIQNTSDSTFTRGKAINLGRVLVTSSTILTLDADMFMKEDGLTSINNAFKNLGDKYIFGFKGYNHDWGTKRFTPRAGTHKTVYGFQVFRTRFFDAVGGFNPFFEGWGGGDTDFRNRLIYRCKVKPLVLEACYVHINHPKSELIPRHSSYNMTYIVPRSKWTGKNWLFYATPGVISNHYCPPWLTINKNKKRKR